MRRSLLLALALSVCPCTGLLAVDLAKIERPAIKLPEPRSADVGYCLLVFGPAAAKRVWLVHDGGRLYVDRNGNGDLTEPGETVAANAEQSRPAEGVFSFKAGDIPDAAGGHKDLNVAWLNVDHMKTIDSGIAARLAREPNFRGCLITLDVALPGQRGQGIDGRVNQMVAIGDCRGLLEFAPRVEDAPIIHFAGPWEVTLSGQETWRVGAKQEVYLVVGTPGVGPGTTACVAYGKVIPAELKPKLEVTYPAAAGTAPLIATHELAQRCCHINLYGDVAVPAEVSTGVATVSVSLASWPGTTVAATKHDVQILPKLPGPKLVPVSYRLAGKLQHEHTDEPTVAIQFSPDGKQLIAGDYPGGLVHVWALDDGRRLATVDMGRGFRSSHHYFVVTPDWKTIVAPTLARRTFDRLERDGKTLTRASYDGSIRAWDLETGNRLHSWKDDPARSTLRIEMLRGGKQFLAHEETAGEFESVRPAAISLWDVATGEHKQLFAGHELIAGFSPDGKQAAVSIPLGGNDNFQQTYFHRELAFYDVASWQPSGTSIPLGEMQRCHSVYFVKGQPIVAGVVYIHIKPNDLQNARPELKFWKLPGGAESWSLAGKEGEAIIDVKPTPDGSAIFVTTHSAQQTTGRLLRVDLATHVAQVVLDQSELRPDPPIFHPGGKWMILPVQRVPQSLAGLMRLALADMAQPHLQARDVATGALLEDLVAPQAFMNSLAFSPDGNTLATSGNGAVMLWDFSDPPGKRPAATVGQPFEAAGKLVGGAKLDWAAYRGKVVLVTYWATWCKPCVAEIPEIRQAYDALHARGFDVLAISLDGDSAVLDRFLAAQPVPWPVVGGATVEASGPTHPLARKYGVESVPQSFLLDRQGNIAATGTHVADLLRLAEKLVAPSDEKK